MREEVQVESDSANKESMVEEWTESPAMCRLMSPVESPPQEFDGQPGVDASCDADGMIVGPA